MELHSRYLHALLFWLTLVVGQQELDQKAVNVRIRDDVCTRNQGVPVALDECLAKLIKLQDERSLKHSLG
jgi:threonyl-tRNA synthetase